MTRSQETHFFFNNTYHGLAECQEVFIEGLLCVCVCGGGQIKEGLMEELNRWRLEEGSPV